MEVQSNASLLTETSTIGRYRLLIASRYQKFLDDSTRHITPRWIATAIFTFLYLVRVYSLGGWYIITYALGIYILNLLIGFLSPQWDPEIEETDASLPTKGDDEFKPFIRRLPEFKFW
jgi:hypothetical protein